MRPYATLVFFNCPSFTAYAISSYERAFLRALKRAVPEDRIHFAYPDLSKGAPETPKHVIRFDPASSRPADLSAISRYVRKHRIDFALGVDQPPGLATQGALRDGGVRRIVSYWGAPMSSLNSGLKLALKQLRYRLHRHTPDHYVFESRAMADSATHGRGVPAANVSIAYLGVDHEAYRPAPRSSILTDRLGIPPDRHVVFFSGHMEPRKGVAVLMRAANILAESRSDFHVLVCGNRPGEEAPYLDMLTTGQGFVTFGGYRDDLPELMPQCYVGAIASTGWDSFTVSALELASCGVPLLVSDLQGLPETIEEGVTGHTFPVGDAPALVMRVGALLDDPATRERMSVAARRRILGRFTLEHQTARLMRACGLTGEGRATE